MLVAKKEITSAEISEYRRLLIIEMKKMGADEHDLALIHDATIRNAVKMSAKPEDVAWAILA